MTNNDILRRIRYTFNLDDSGMISTFRKGGLDVTREQISDWLKKEEDPAFQKLNDRSFAVFLNGFIIVRRGKKDGPQPEPEKRLTNNIIFKKLRIALDLKAEDVLDLLDLAGVSLGKSELSAFFRKPGHRHFRECKDQILRNFLKGMQAHFRPAE